MNSFRGFLPILLVIAIIVGGYFFAYPQYTNLQASRDDLAVARKHNEDLKKSEAAIDSFLRQYHSLDNQAQQASKILPYKKTDLQNVITNMESFASTSGVSLASMSFTDSNLTTTTKADYKVSFIELNMTILGTYPSFKAYLLQMENTIRLMDITSVSLQTGDINSSSLRYNLIARVYYQN